ncbi:MAG TPA: transposase [Terriglobales bacterium]
MSSSMRVRSKRTYTEEFREQAVNLVLVSRLSQREAARGLSVPSKTLGNWVRAATKRMMTGVRKRQKPVTELEAELARVTLKLEMVTLERDMLENAIASRRSRSALM